MICTLHPVRGIFFGGVIKSRRMRWVGRVARIARGEDHTELW